MSYDQFLRDAEFFCDKAEETRTSSSLVMNRFSTASILFSFIAVESFINNMMSDFTALPPDTFSPHEEGFLTEKAVELSESGANAGQFEVTNRRQYRSLESKIMFLVAKFSGDTVDKGSSLWQRFVESKDVRDRLTHPRKNGAIPTSPADARNVLKVAREIIQLVSLKVWGKSVMI